MDTALKHVLKEEYVIYYLDSGKRRYLNTVYSSSTNCCTDVDDAMKLKTLEMAKGALALASNFDTKEYHICHIATIVEDIDLNSENKEEDQYGI